MAISHPQQHPQPHDLVWVESNACLISQTALPDWVNAEWDCSLPLVVRRDIDPENGLIPVGIRGSERSKRAAVWVEPSNITKHVSPEALVHQIRQHHIKLDSIYPALSALVYLLSYEWPWRWGITGSCGYALATQVDYITHQSDLDLVIYCPDKAEKSQFEALFLLLPQLPCRVDIQLESPNGACSLTEWYTKPTVLLKTNSGPVLVAEPWSIEENAI